MINKLEVGDVLLLSEDKKAVLVQVKELTDEGFGYERLYYGEHQAPKTKIIGDYPMLFNIDGFNFYDYKVITEIEESLGAQIPHTNNAVKLPENNIIPDKHNAEWGKTAGLEYVQLSSGDVYFDYRRLDYQEKVGIITDQL